MSLTQWTYASPVGPLHLVASPTGLRGLYWKTRKVPYAKSLRGEEPALKVLAQTVKELDAYFRGEQKNFTVKLDLEGTLFQKSVWAELLRIPYGQTRSYREIAARLKKPKAFRAVGTANGKNPLSLLVPCHRVIAADGTLGGYAGGLRIKSELLNHEGAKFRA